MNMNPNEYQEVGNSSRRATTVAQELRNHLRIILHQCVHCKALLRGAIYNKLTKACISKRDWMEIVQDGSIRAELLGDIESLVNHIRNSKRVQQKVQYILFLQKFVFQLREIVKESGIDQKAKEQFEHSLKKLNASVILFQEEHPNAIEEQELARSKRRKRVSKKNQQQREHSHVQQQEPSHVDQQELIEQIQEEQSFSEHYQENSHQFQENSYQFQ